MRTKYLFPMIVLGPPKGYNLNYLFPVERLTKHMPHTAETLQIERIHFYNGKVIKIKKGLLEYNGKKWVDTKAATYKCESIIKGEENLSNIEYIETHIEILTSGFFNNPIYFTPLNYTVYNSIDKKNFISDGQLKFGALRTIDQFSAFNKWIEGYPDCNISKLRNIDESIIIINPYPADAKVYITLDGSSVINKSIMVKSLIAIKLPISSIIKNNNEWSGQVIIKGKNRLILFFMKHRMDKPSHITTLEHSENYRGEPTYYSFSNTLKKIKQKILR